MTEMQSEVDNPAHWVLDPIDMERFFTHYWEQKPLHIARRKSNPFASLVSIDAIERLLATNALNYPTVQLSHAGQSIPISDYTDDNEFIVSNRIIERYKSGSTIVISNAHRLVSNLMTLCRSIQSSFMMRCQTNIYLSPAGNQGFNPHYDTHDVFILQVSGKKTFNFYSAGADAPTSADRFNSDIHSIGEKTEEIALEAGDTLYIPRGFVHDAIADTRKPSLHITLGVYPVMLHTLVGELTQIALESDARLRRSVNQSAWMQQESVSATTALIKDALQPVLQDNAVASAMQRLRDDIALDCLPANDGLLSAAVQPQITVDSVLSINRSRLLHTERAENRLILRLYGRVVEFSDPMAGAIEWLLDQHSLRVRDLPNLTPEQQVALIRQLIALDILTITTNGSH